MKFVCRRCGACCRWPGCVKLADGECGRIAGFLGISEDEFIGKWTRISPDRQCLSLIEKSDGSCVFLELCDGGAAECRIDPVKPRQCCDFPEKWNFPEWQESCPGVFEEQNIMKTGGRTGNLIVLSGPSGAGKSTLVNAARKALPDLEFSISCTTRPPRAGEVDGREYHFLSPEEFEERSRRGEFVEEARVFANRYGTLKSEVLERVRRGADVILDIDVQGAASIRAAAERDVELANAAVFVLIVPPSLEILERRLRSRATDSEEQLALRIAAAERELANFRLYDYVIVNDDLDTAAGELEGLFRAFRLRTRLIPEGEMPWRKK